MTVRITGISMHSFRAVPGELTIELPDGRSLLILGDNGTGKSSEFDPSALRGGGKLTGSVGSDLTEFEKVEKLGRTTGRTKGRITAFELDNVVVSYDMGNIKFDDQLEIESSSSKPFSQGGDSGSLIFTTEERLALGLLFAGSDQGGRNGTGLTYANPFPTVLSKLKAELLLDSPDGN